MEQLLTPVGFVRSKIGNLSFSTGDLVRIKRSGSTRFTLTTKAENSNVVEIRLEGANYSGNYIYQPLSFRTSLPTSGTIRRVTIVDVTAKRPLLDAGLTSLEVGLLIDSFTKNDFTGGKEIYQISDATLSLLANRAQTLFSDTPNKLPNAIPTTFLSDLTLTGNGNIEGIGNESNNKITGNTKNNSIFGLGGIDILIGGLGRDNLSGGADPDIFRFDSALSSSANVDLVTDFRISENDKIQLENTGKGLFNALPAVGTLSQDAFVIAPVFTSTSQRIRYNARSLFYDPDGSGRQLEILFAQLGPGSEEISSFMQFEVT